MGDFENSSGSLIRIDESYEFREIDVNKELNSYSVDQILISDIFNNVSPRNTNTENSYKRYIELKRKTEKKEEEKKEMEKLKSTLEKLPLWNDINNREIFEKIRKSPKSSEKMTKVNINRKKIEGILSKSDAEDRYKKAKEPIIESWGNKCFFL